MCRPILFYEDTWPGNRNDIEATQYQDVIEYARLPKNKTLKNVINFRPIIHVVEEVTTYRQRGKQLLERMSGDKWPKKPRN